jgi:cytochrome c-type biogenesis protein CcmF
MEFYKGTIARMLQYQETVFRAITTLMFKNNRKYGGYIVHLGIVLIFAGIAGTAYKRIYEFDMKPNETKIFEDYAIVLKDFESFDHPNQEETYAVLELYQRNQKVGTLKPGRFFYKQQEQPSTEVDIYSRWSEDVYFTLGNIDPATETGRIQVTLNPMVSFLWLGGLILAIGGLIAMLPPLRSTSTKANP